MAKVIEKTGKTIDEAIQAAVAELGVSESDLEVEILQTPARKFFGLLGETPAKIRATVKEIAPPVKVPEPARQVEVPAVKESVAETVESVVEEPVNEPVKEFEPVLEPSPVVEEKSELEPVDRDKAVESAKKFLQDVFSAMGIEIEIEVIDAAEDGFIFNLIGKNLGVLIGRRGQSLDALQYLLNLAVNRKSEDKIHFTLDVENYRHRREVALTKLAKGVADRAIKTRKDVRLEAMNRHERKIIHTVLQENDRVETHSAGEEPYRYVIVSPVKRGRR